jgi:hypothetical protein
MSRVCGPAALRTTWCGNRGGTRSPEPGSGAREAPTAVAYPIIATLKAAGASAVEIPAKPRGMSERRGLEWDHRLEGRGSALPLTSDMTIRPRLDRGPKRTGGREVEISVQAPDG